MFGIYYVGSTMLLSVAMLTEISLIVLTINNIDMQFRDTVMLLATQDKNLVVIRGFLAAIPASTTAGKCCGSGNGFGRALS